MSPILYDADTISKVNPYKVRLTSFTPSGEIEEQDEDATLTGAATGATKAASASELTETEQGLPAIPSFEERYGGLAEQMGWITKEQIETNKETAATAAASVEAAAERQKYIDEIKADATEQRRLANEDWQKFSSGYRSQAFLSDTQYSDYSEGEKTYKANLANIDEAERKAIEGIASFYDVLDQTELKSTEFWSTFRQYINEDESLKYDENGQPIGFFEDIEAAQAAAPTYRAALEAYKAKIQGLEASTDKEIQDARTAQITDIDKQLAFIASFEANPKGYMSPQEKASHMSAWQKSYKAWQKSPWYMKWTPLAPLPMAMAQAPKSVISALEWWHTNVDETWGAMLYQAGKIIYPFTPAFVPTVLTESKFWEKKTWEEEAQLVKEKGVGQAFLVATGWDELRNPFSAKGKEQYRKEVPGILQFAMEFTNPIYWVGIPLVGKIAGKAAGAAAKATGLTRALPVALTELGETAAWRVGGEEASIFLRGTEAMTNPYVASIERYLGWVTKYPALAERLPTVARMVEPITAKLATALLPVELAARAAVWGAGVGGRVASTVLKAYMLPWTLPLKAVGKAIGYAAPKVTAQVAGRLSETVLTKIGRVAKTQGWNVKYLGGQAVEAKMPVTTEVLEKVVQTRLGQLEPDIAQQIVRFVEKTVGAKGPLKWTPEELQFQETYGKQIETVLEEVKATQATAPVHAAFKMVGTGAANRGVTLYARDVGEVWTVLESGTLTPAQNARWLSERLWVEEAGKGGVEVPVYARGEFISPNMPLKGKISVSANGLTVYESEGLGKSGLTVISETDVLQGIKPSWATEAQWEAAKTAFGQVWEQDRRILENFTRTMYLPDNAELLHQRFAIDRWRQAATLVAKTKVGRGVVNALNKSAIDEDVVSQGAIMWAEIIWRGQAYRTSQMMRLYQFGKSTGIFGVRMLKTADYEYPIASKVELKEGFTEGQVIKLADGEEYQITRAFGDVLQWKPGAADCPYKFTPTQAAYLEELHGIHADMYRFVEGERQRLIAQGLEDEGPWLAKTDLNDSMSYVHRTTHGKVGIPNVQLQYYGGRRIGARVSFQHSRIYEYMQDGANAGIIYGRNAEEYVSSYIDGCFQIVAGQRFAWQVQDLGETMAQAMERMYPGLEDALRMETNRLHMLGGGTITFKGNIIKATEYRGFRAAIKDAYESGWMRKGTLNQIQRYYPEMVGPVRTMMRQANRPLEKELVKMVNYYKTRVAEIESRLKIEKGQRAAVERAFKEAEFVSLPPIGKLKATLKIMNEDLKVAFHQAVDQIKTQVEDDLARAGSEAQGMAETLASDPVWNYKAPYGWYWKRKGGIATNVKVERRLSEVVLSKPRVTKAGERLVGGEVPESITPATFKLLKGKAPPQEILLKNGRIDVHDALDAIADNLGMTTDEVIERLNQLRPFQKGMKDAEIDSTNLSLYQKQLQEIEDAVVASYEGKRMTGASEPLSEEVIPVEVERPEAQAYVKAAQPTAEATEAALGITSKAKARDIRDQLLEFIDHEVERRKESLRELQLVAKNKREIVAAGAGQRKVWIMNQPAFRGRMFEPEIANTIEKALANETHSWLQKSAQISGFGRTAVAALDFSAPFIQGLPVLGHDVANAMAGKPTFAWAKAVGRHYQAFWSEKGYAQYLLKNRAAIEEFTLKYGGYVGGSEYFEAMAEWRGYITTMTEKASMKGIPLANEVGSILDKGLWQTYGRAERAFGAFGDAARIEMWNALKPITKTKDLYDVAQMLSLMTGVSNSKGLGIGLGQRQLESAFIFFAPRYTRAGFALVANIFRGGIRGEMARKALAGYLSGGMAMYYGTCKALGQDMQLDPRNARFMCIRVGNQWIGPGGFYTWALRFMSNVIYSGVKSPSDFWTLNRQDNPFLKAFYAKLSPLSSTVVELATRRNYIGEPIEGRRGYGDLLISKIAPIMLQNVIIPEDRANFPAFVAGVLGMRTFPRSIWEHLNEYRNSAANAVLDLTPAQVALKDQRGYLRWDDLTWMQRHKLNETDADLTALTDEAYAQSIRRGNTYLARVKDWRDKLAEIKTFKKSQWDTISAEYQHNMNLKAQLDGGATLSTEDQTAAKEAGKRFRERLAELGNVMSGRYDQLKVNYKDVYDSFEELKAKNPDDQYVGDLAYDDYLQTMYDNDGLYDEYGNYDYDAAREAEAKWQDKWGGPGTSTYEYVQSRIKESRDEPPLLQELRKAREVLKPYWELKDALVATGQYPADSTEQGQYLLRDVRAQNPLAADYYEAMEKLRLTDPKSYTAYRRTRYMQILYEAVGNLTVPTVESVLDEERLKWRQEHLDADKYLVMFYDLQPISERS